MTIPAAARILLDLIYRTETGRSPPTCYTTIIGHREGQLQKPITAMTLDELMAAQRTWGKKWKSSAAGAPQIIGTYRLLRQEIARKKRGFYSAGETACVSVHGGNRLGTNSLLDLVVFGRRSGIDMARFCRESDHGAIPNNPTEQVEERFAQLLGTRSTGSGEPAARLREEMQDAMQDGVGIFRTGKGMETALDRVRELKERYNNVVVMDKGKVFNTDLLEAWELGNLLDLAEVTATCALTRTESRGAHMREDFPKRNDVDWLKHSLSFRGEGGKVDLDYKPVTITKFEPKERVY